MLTQDEINKLQSCRTSAEWNVACDEVKAAHGGYPSDWWPRVIQSGMMDKALGQGASSIQLLVPDTQPAGDRALGLPVFHTPID